MNQELNLTPFYIEALVYMKSSYKAIDALYNSSYQSSFYKFEKKSNLYPTPFTQELSLEQEVYYKKLVGIIEYISQEQTEKTIQLDKELFTIYKKTFEKTYSYFQNSNLPIDMLQYLEHMSSYFLRLPVNEQHANQAAALLFALKIVPYNEIKNIPFFISQFAKRWNYTCHGIHKIALEKVPEETKKEIQSFLRQLPPDYLKMIYSDDKIFLPYDFLYDMEGISTYNIFSELSLTITDVKEIILAYLLRANYEIDFISYFVPAAHIKYLIKAYKKAKKYYFKNSKEELTIKIKEKENELLKQKEIVYKEREKWKEKEEMFQVLQKENKQKIQELQNKNQSLQKEIDKLKEQLEKKKKE